MTDTTTECDVGFLRVDRLTILTPSGDTIERIMVVHPGAVAVVALDGPDLILIDQYRAPVDDIVREIPAGRLDIPGEDPMAAAGRELTEETGYSADSLVHLTDLRTGVGFTNEVIAIYLAPSITPGPPMPQGAEEQEATIVRMPFADALQAVSDGSITDAKTVAGILLTERLRGSS